MKFQTMIRKDGSTNLYVEHKRIYDFAKLNINKSKYIDSNVIGVGDTLGIIDYIADYDINLKDVEKTYSKESQKKNIKGNILKIANPIYSKEKISKTGKLEDITKVYPKIVKNIVESIGQGIKINYVSFETVENEVEYINIVFFDRYYYAKGKEITKTYTSDWYVRSKNNHIRCLKSCPGAWLKHKKGDEYKKVIYLSDKTRVFNFATKEEFEQTIKSIKKEIIKIIYSIGMNPKEVDYMAKKSLKKAKKKRNRWFKTQRVDNTHNKYNWYKYRRIKSENKIYTEYNHLLILNGYINTKVMKELKQKVEQFLIDLKKMKIKSIKDYENTINSFIMNEMKN